MTDIGKWHEHKLRLADKGLVDAVFLNLNDLHFKLDSEYTFEPLLIARHAQRLGELIDRSLLIRKDIRELEVLAVKAATDYELFKGTSNLDEQMDILRLQIPSKSSERSGFERAVGAFSSTTLESGLAAIAKGRDGALREDLNSSATISDLTAVRWRRLREYQDAYHARHNESGNAHNYAERVRLLLEVLDVLMKEALARANALSIGINRVYHAQLPAAPTDIGLGNIDRFAVWALKTIQSLSRAAEQETASEIVIPLVQPWLASGQPLITEADFNSAVSGATGGQPVQLRFELPSSPLLDPQVRVKSVGLSFGNDIDLVPGSGFDRNQTADNYTRLIARISTPAQVDEHGKTYFRPPVLIGNVALHGTAAGAVLVEGNSVENISPFGKWKIDIHPLLVWKDGSKQSIAQPTYSKPIKDLKLALRLYVPGRFE